MKEQFTEPVIETRELTPAKDVMDEPVFISGNEAIDSTVIVDAAGGFNIWKGKQR